jgi:hypothetical protein
MNTISYDPSEDELLLIFAPTEGEPYRKLGSLKLWSDSEGNIRAVAITQYIEESKEFRRNLNTIQLGGIWKGIRISDEDIRANREELLKNIEGKW